MKVLISAIREMKLALTKLHLFDALFNSLLIFLAAYLVLSIFNIPIILALSITLAYLIVELAKRASINKIRQVEYYYPKLNERLRTSAEYARVENPVVNELHQEVLAELKNVQEAEFMDERKLISKAGIAALLCFLILLLAPLSIKLDAIEPAIEKAKSAANISITFEKGESDAKAGSGGKISKGLNPPKEEDIFGTASIAKLGEEELKLVIKPAGDSINIREVKEVEQREFEESYPKEVFAVSAATFDERIPREQQEIVKNYFTAIAQG